MCHPQLMKEEVCVNAVVVSFVSIIILPLFYPSCVAAAFISPFHAFLFAFEKKNRSFRWNSLYTALTASCTEEEVKPTPRTHLVHCVRPA